MLPEYHGHIYRGTDETCPPDFGQGDSYTNSPPPTTGPNICITWYILSHFLKKIAHYARSIALYKISVQEITEIWEYTCTTAQYCIYFITPKFMRLLRYLIKMTERPSEGIYMHQISG